MAGPILIPRIAAALVRGYMGQHNWSTGMCFGNNPHIYNGKAGLLDIDMLQHMNNASYFTHVELARWELFAQSGLIPWIMSKKAGSIIASANIRYRREVKAFQSFEVHTCIAATDEKSIFISQNFHSTGGGELLAQYITRTIIRGPTIIHPLEFLIAAKADDKIIKQISSSEAHNDVIKAFNALEFMQRKI